MAEDASRETVLQVVESIYSNIGAQLTVEDMARTAMFSKFHFTRLFRKVTGVSPGRFLAAVRIQEAKRLLVSTDLSVTEISHQVGYTSLGTFSTKFRATVGATPSTYRDYGGFTVPACMGQPQRGQANTASVKGKVLSEVPTGALGPVFVGLFPERIPQGLPVRCAVLAEPGEFTIDGVPEGTWYVLAHSVSEDRDAVIRARIDAECGLSIGATGPLRIARDQHLDGIELTLRPKRRIDPPVVLALMDIRRHSMRSDSA